MDEENATLDRLLARYIAEIFNLDRKTGALYELLDLSSQKGHITIDDIKDICDVFSLSIQETDWVSDKLISKNVVVFEREYADYTKLNYEKIYKRIIELDNTLESFVMGVKRIIPPQKGEADSLKQLVLEGDQKSRNRLIEMYLRNALRFALQFTETYNTDIDETIAIAVEGLVNAADKYSPDKNGGFSSYASRWIMQNLRKMQATKNPLIRYSTRIKEVYYLVYPLLKLEEFPNTISDLSTVAIEKLRNDYQLNDNQILELLMAGTPVESIDILIDEGRLIEIPMNSYEDPVFELFAQVRLRERLDHLLGTLTYREQEMLSLYFGLDDGIDRTLEEVGDFCYVSRATVGLIIKRALRKLHHPARSRQLKDF